jgi:hypothetical protein
MQLHHINFFKKGNLIFFLVLIYINALINAGDFVFAVVSRVWIDV